MLNRVFSFSHNGCNEIAILLLFFISTNAFAATRTTIVTTILRGDNTEKRTDIFTVDGHKARLNMYFGKEPTAATTSTMLTVDGGKTWFLTDPGVNKTVCTKWDTTSFFKGMGELLSYAQELLGADVKDSAVKVTLDEPGPKLLGHATRHLKLRYSLNAVAWILIIKREYTLEFHDEVWYSPDLKLSNIEQAWLNAMSKTGFNQLDRLSTKWNQKVNGTVIRMISDVTIHNVTKNEKRHKQERMEITKLEEMKSTELPAGTFKVPACNKVSKDEMEEAAKNMLKGIAR